MIALEFDDRTTRLLNVRLEERGREFPRELRAIAGRLSPKGLLKSSVHLEQLKQAHERELEVRGIVIWECIVRVHRTLGAQNPPVLAGELKELFQVRLEGEFAVLAQSFEAQCVKILPSHAYDLSEARKRVLSTHDVEIDLYVDSLFATKQGVAANNSNTQSYNFYGNVGAVQTGAHAIANTVQGLGVDDVSALRSALGEVQKAIAEAATLQEKQRSELLELASEAEAQLSRPDANGTKLMATLNVLAAAVQGIASAQPAYAAIKAALLPLGVTLP